MFLFPKHLEAYYTIYKKPRIVAAITEKEAPAKFKLNEKKKSALSVIAAHLKGNES